MAHNKPLLKLYSLSHPIMHTEWDSIFGDKYCHALPFDYVLTDKMDEASVIAWDGVISLKQRRYANEIIALLEGGKIWLKMGEGATLFRDHPYITVYESSQVETIQLTGWSVLPEEIISGLMNCYQKITNV